MFQKINRKIGMIIFLMYFETCINIGEFSLEHYLFNDFKNYFDKL